MSLLNKLTEAVLNELNYKGFKDKQGDITQLFPKFPDRKKAVYANNGVRLSESFPEVWWFKVASGTQPGVEYDVYLRFKNILDTVKKFIGNRELWTKDGLRCNYNKLSPQVFNTLDLEMDCSCPADTFWGPEYIKTQYKSKPGGIAQFGDEENRPPVKRNPDQHGIVCKHGACVIERLPMFTGDFASHLKVFYGEDIQKMVDKIRSEETPEEEEVVPPTEEAPKETEEAPVEEPEVKSQEDLEKEKSDRASTFYKGKLGDSIVKKVNKWKSI